MYKTPIFLAVYVLFITVCAVTVLKGFKNSDTNERIQQRNIQLQLQLQKLR